MKIPYYKYYTGFTRLYRFFLNIISFQHDLHFGVGRSQIEWNMKVKIEISICTGLMLNDHSNPYIESTTVLSDKYIRQSSRPSSMMPDKAYKALYAPKPIHRPYTQTSPLTVGRQRPRFNPMANS